MGRLGGVDPHPGGGRRHQPGIDQGRVVGALQLLLLLLPGFGQLRAVQPPAQVLGRVHRRALAVGRAEAGEGEPGFVPEEHQVRLDRQALLHDPLHIVDDAVEGAVGQEQHSHPVELARRLQLQQLVLDFRQRNRAIHRVCVQRIAVEIDHLRARQHHAVMVRLVTVAVDQNDVARAYQRLHHDLVAGRGAVGGEEGLLGAEGACRQFLRFLDRPVRLEQAIEPARGRRGLGQEDVGAVEGAHVLDPVRARDRLAAADRHGVEDAGRLLGILLERGEKRRLLARGDPTKDVQVQFQKILLVVEHPAAAAEVAPGDVLDRAVGDQIGVQLRADPGDQAAELGAVFARGQRVEILVTDPVEVFGQDRQRVARLQRQSRAHHDGLDVVVEQDSDQRVLEARHHHRLIDEGVLGAAHPGQAGAQPALLMLAHLVNQQHLEIGPGQRARLDRQGRLVLDLLGVAVVAGKRDGAASIGAGGQRTNHAPDREGQILPAPVVELAAHVVEGGQAREGPVHLDRGQRLEQLLGAPGQLRRTGVLRPEMREPVDGLAQRAPAVGSELDGTVVVADRMRRRTAAALGQTLGHDRLPTPASHRAAEPPGRPHQPDAFLPAKGAISAPPPPRFSSTRSSPVRGSPASTPAREPCAGIASGPRLCR